MTLPIAGVLGPSDAPDPVVRTLRFFLPGYFGAGKPFLASEKAKDVVSRLASIQTEPLSVTHFNQLLHLTHQAGVTPGFFRYYFTTQPKTHAYAAESVLPETPELNPLGIGSLAQLEWGLRRFYTDALLFWSDIRSAYRVLRTLSYEQISDLFSSKRFPTDIMEGRGRPLPFQEIPVDDRYLVSEIACKAYEADVLGSPVPIETILIDAFRKGGAGRRTIGSLFDEKSALYKEDPLQLMLLQVGAEELMNDEVQSEEEIRARVQTIARRFVTAREGAVKNTTLYLSIVNELDIYVATSMRKRDDFRSMAADCKYIFSQDALQRFNIRYFDPTTSAAESHEDKGLIECLMVKCAKAVVYFAGEKDSFGKDAEIAMGMSLGKPVIILCPDTSPGQQRERFFRDMHPLSRLIQFETGVAVGAMVTRSKDVVARLLERIFDNRMEYDLENRGDGYFRLRERLTNSVVRLQTSSRMLRESFWNYYHGVQ
jgi:hypothetical protein